MEPKTGLIGLSLTSHEHAGGYMRHPFKGHGMGGLEGVTSNMQITVDWLIGRRFTSHDVC